MNLRLASLALLLGVGVTFADDKKPKIADLPTPVSSLGAIECDGYLYVYGGHAGKTHSYDTKTVIGTFQRIKISEGTKWEELPSGPILQGMNLATHGGKIYRVGGMQPKNAPSEPTNNHSVTDAVVFDPTTKKWSDLPSLPSGRSSHDVVVSGDKLYVVGGWEQKGKGEKSVWCEHALSLDLKAKGAKWEKIEQPFQRRALSATSVNGKIYVLGGLDSTGKSHQRVDILDTATGKWSQGPDFPGKSVGFSPASTTFKGTVVVSTLEGGLFRLNSNKNEWEKVGESTTNRMVHRIVPSGNYVLLVGGASKAGPVPAVEPILVNEKGEPVTSTKTGE